MQVTLATARCERCGHPFPGFRGQAKQALLRGALLLAAVGALTAFALY
jgi:hypothetical protein